MNSIIQALLKKIKTQPNISEIEKKWQRIYDLFNAKTKPRFLCLYNIKKRTISLQKKSFLMKRGRRGLNKREKKAFYLLSQRRFWKTLQRQ